MGPPEDPCVELARLLLWWSVWSLLDYGLLRFSPVSELVVVLATSIALLLVFLSATVRRRFARTRQRIPEAVDGSPSACTDSV